MPAAFDPYYLWLGIPPSEQPPDHYRLLGIERFEANLDVIAMAADRQLGYLRTFQTGPHAEDSQRLLNEVAAARICLLNPEKKAAYDERLRASLAPQPSQPERGPMDDLADAVSEEIPRSRAKPKPDRSLRRLVTVVSASAAAVAVGLVLWYGPFRTPVAVNQPGVRDRAPAMAERPAPGQPPATGEAVTPPKASPLPSPLQPPSQGSDVPAAEPGPKPVAPAAAPPDVALGKSEEPPAPVVPETPSMGSESEKPDVDLPELPGPAVPAAEPPKSSAPGIEKPLAGPELDPALNEAWAMIGRGEHVPAEQRLMAARKIDQDDVRAAFSLGLLRALVGRDWATAQKHFEQCVKQQPEDAAALNDLALVRVRLNKDGLALRHWDTVLAAGNPPDEVAQNLGRLAQLVKTGRLAMKPETQRMLEDLVQRAGATTKFRLGTKFLFMAPRLPSGKTFAWPASVGYEDRWCIVCGGRGQVRCPVRDCARGMVRQMKTEVISRDPVSGKAVTSTHPVRVPCPKCKGRGFVDCPACDRGKEK